MRFLNPALKLSSLRIALLVLSLLSPPVMAQAPVILVMGDSLSAAYGIDEEKGWVNLLRQRLEQSSLSASVINSSISGETSAGGLRRLPELLTTYNPSVVILELGANDGLRGYPVKTMAKKLQSIIDLSHDNQSEVLLLGMQIPPNYGRRYSQMFRDTYLQLQRENDIAMVPFLLDGVATKPELMQTDGLHPKAEAQAQILDNVWPHLKMLLDNLQVSNQ